jgi:hypothetical protein
MTLRLTLRIWLTRMNTLLLAVTVSFLPIASAT